MIDFATIIDSVLDERGEVIRITPRRSKTTPSPHPERMRLAFLERVPYAKRTIRALIIGFEAASLRCHKRNLSLMSLLRRVARQIILLGPETALPYLKSAYVDLRRLIISEAPRDEYFHSVLGRVLPRGWRNISDNKIMQICMTGRALPRPTPAMCERAVATAVETMSNPYTVLPSPKIIDVLELILPKAVKIPLVTKGEQLSEQAALCPIYGTSATSLNSRKEGGRAGIIFAAERTLRKPVGPVLALRRQAAIKRVSAPVRFSFTNFASKAIVAESSRATVGAIQNKFPYNSESFTVAIPESGFKCRVATKSHPLLVTDGHMLRRQYFPSLRTYRFTRKALGDRPKYLPFANGSGQRRLFLSADLSKATDGLSHLIVSEVCRILEIDPDIIYQNMSVDGHRLERGIFMGLPMSWTILSYVHAAVCLNVGGPHTFYIKGDDLVAYWTRRQIAKYRDLMVTVGLPINESKTFIGRNRALFCEGYYQAVFLTDRKGRKVAGLVLVNHISLRRFFPDREASAISIAEAALDVVPGLNKPFNRLVRGVFPRLLRASARFKLNPFLPRNLGGSGLLIPEPSHEVKSATDRVRLNAIFGGIPRFSLEAPRHYVGSNMRQLSDLMRLVRMVPTGSAPWCPHFDEWLAFATSAAAYRDAKIGKFPKKTKNVDVFRECRRIARDSRQGIDFPITYAALSAVVKRLVPMISSVPYHCKCKDPAR